MRPSPPVACVLGGGLLLLALLPYHHAIWHAFVLAGSSFHYAAVLRYVARA
jgi:hemolysin III